MADPHLILQGYGGGMKRDTAREALPNGVLWNSQDWLPEILNSRLRKRGAWTNASLALPSGASVTSGIIADYSTGQSHLVFTDGNAVYAVVSTSNTETPTGSALGYTAGQPVFYNDMVIVPDYAGVVAPNKVLRSAGVHQVVALGGSPPAGRYLAVYKDVLWNAGSLALPKRIYFAVAGNPESYDTTLKILDVSYPITGIATLANAVLVFMLGRTARIRGSIPPPDSDFVVDDPQFDVGCTDNRSIANYRDKVIWANAGGLYITDGTALEDLTKITGMKSWWRDVMAGRAGFFAPGTKYDPTTWKVAGGVYGDYYFYAVTQSTNLVDSGMIDLTRFTWHRHNNIRGAAFWRRAYPEELFFGRRDSARVGALSDIFAPTVTGHTDGDGSIVTPVLETAFIEGNPVTKTMRRLYMGYDLRDTLSNAPTLAIQYATDPSASTYTALDAFGPTTQYTRDYRALSFPARGLALKIVQAGKSDDTRLYAVELDAQAREAHR